MTEAQALRSVERRSFYHWMALACLAISVLGFVPTFFLPIAQGTFTRPPTVYLHGLLFFSWVAFFCAQTWLASSGRILAHREWGLVGVALATAMAFSVMTMAIVGLHATPPKSPGLVLGDVWNIAFFEGCVIAALANVRRPEAHKRLMLLATISIIAAAIGRWYVLAILALLGPSAPQLLARINASEPLEASTVLVMEGPLLLAALLIVAAMVFDHRSRRRVSPVYAIGLPVYLLGPPVIGLFAYTPMWLAIIDWLRGFGG